MIHSDSEGDVGPTAPKGRPGAAFERLAAAVQVKLDPSATVTWNERIQGRQIDVAVRGAIGSAKVLVIVECRDYQDPLGIDHIDRLCAVRSEVEANKAILVTRTGFTRDALEKGEKVGIDMCLLRKAENSDWPGPGVPLLSIQMTIGLIGTNIDDLEVELVDGRRLPCGPFSKLRDRDGNEEFIDRIIKSWLSTNGSQHVSGEPLHLSLDPPPQLLWDDEEPDVTKLHCVPRVTRGPDYVSLWRAPQQWVFFQLRPSGVHDEKRFFEFPDLNARATTFANRALLKREP